MECVDVVGFQVERDEFQQMHQSFGIFQVAQGKLVVAECIEVGFEDSRS